MIAADQIAAAVAAGEVAARDVIEDTLLRIERAASLNAFTAVFAAQALADADALDAAIAAGKPVGPLAGVPFAVKNLFDVAGVITLAGSIIERGSPPADRDATLVARLKAAGAILVGTLNMDEYAYGFSTENAHYGPTRNPHDPNHIAGGSSGGSAAAVAAGLVPLTLGSDTNGSIRVPASLCGVYGMKPTLGRLSRQGAFPFVESLDHTGLFAASPRELALAYDVLQGADPEDPICERGAEPALSRLDDNRDFKVGVLGGWFTRGAFPEALSALDQAALALNAEPVELAGAEAARAAAFSLTASEGAHLHAQALRTRPLDFDPAVRDRLLAGALLPEGVAEAAHRYRPIFRDAAARLFERFDVLLALATPCTAPGIGQATMTMAGEPVSVRKTLGAYTQPISYIGLPVVTAPLSRPGQMPIGVQVIAPAWREDLALAVAARLDRLGVAAVHDPKAFA